MGQTRRELWLEEAKRNIRESKNGKRPRSSAVTRNAAWARKKRNDVRGRRLTNQIVAGEKKAAVAAARNGINRVHAKAEEKAAGNAKDIKRRSINR